MSLLFSAFILFIFGIGSVEVALFTICKNVNFMEHLICQSYQKIPKTELWQSGIFSINMLISSLSPSLPLSLRARPQRCDHIRVEVCMWVSTSVANCLQNI